MSQLPPDVQKRLIELQKMTEDAARLESEIRVLERELNEINEVLSAISGLPDDAPVYKSVGHILVRKTKSEVAKELEDRKEIVEMKLGAKRKQLAELRREIERREKELRQLASLVK